MENFTYDYAAAAERFKNKRRVVIEAKIRDGGYTPVEGLPEPEAAEKEKKVIPLKRGKERNVEA